MGQSIRRLALVIDGGPDSDAEELAGLTNQLRRRLLELDVEAVDLVRSDDIPPGAKPIDAVTIGALIVTMAPAALNAVVGFVKTWLENRPVRRVTVTMNGDSLELTGGSRADQHQIVQTFVEKHTQR